jgi:hypothetical protein
MLGKLSSSRIRATTRRTSQGVQGDRGREGSGVAGDCSRAGGAAGAARERSGLGEEGSRSVTADASPVSTRVRRRPVPMGVHARRAPAARRADGRRQVADHGHDRPRGARQRAGGARAHPRAPQGADPAERPRGRERDAARPDRHLLRGPQQRDTTSPIIVAGIQSSRSGGRTSSARSISS